MKQPGIKPKRKKQKGSAPSHQKTTLADLLALIDAAADDEEISAIIDGLSPGKRGFLYSALLYTVPSLPAPGAEQPTGNRLHALHILRELLL